MKQIMFPGKLVIGSDLLQTFYSHASCFGKRFVFIGGKRALAASEDVLKKSAGLSGCTASFVPTGNISSRSEMDRIAGLREVKESEVICAIGGGNCMDIARSIAFELGKYIIMIPTTASSDAAATFVSLVYAEDGSRILGVNTHHKCPDMIFLDTKVIAEAPPRLLASGMGDAMATWYEGAACSRHPEAGRQITRTAMGLAALCRKVLEESGEAAYQAVCAGVVTPQLEEVVEANCLLSSVGGLNTGCAGAHGIGDWLVTLPGGHDYMHGERVFVGLIVQMILEKYPLAEIIKVMRFGKTVGLPLCFGDLFGKERVQELAERAGSELQDDHFMKNLTCDYSPAFLSGAVVFAQSLADSLE